MVTNSGSRPKVGNVTTADDFGCGPHKAVGGASQPRVTPETSTLKCKRSAAARSVVIPPHGHLCLPIATSATSYVRRTPSPSPPPPTSTP